MTSLINDRNKKKTIPNNDTWLINLFIILPVIDTLNGFFIGLPIGKVYKMALGIIALINLINKNKGMKIRYFIILIFSLFLVSFSILINVISGSVFYYQDFAIKLIFNILLGVSLFHSLDVNIMSGVDIYKILNVSSWLFIACYLIPYFLGVGNSTYAGDIGYKAFFIAQNELSLVVIVFCFFTSYSLIEKILIPNVAKLGLLLLCAMLLNTKTAMVACLIAVVIWLAPIIIRGNIKLKIASILVLIIGFLTLKNSIINAVTGSLYRFNMLTNNNFGGSLVVGLLSGRTNFVVNAWNEMTRNDLFIIKLIIGNGFCSKILTEMDPIDIFFYLGIIGFMFFMIIISKILKLTIINSKNDKSRIRVISLWIVIAEIFLAGHVLFMSTAGCYFVLYLCFLIYYRPCLPIIGDCSSITLKHDSVTAKINSIIKSDE